MQAISGALQKAGGIILRLVRETAIMLARAFAPVVVRSARGGWETLVCRRCCWTVETVCANVRTKRQPLLLLLHSRTADAKACAV